MPPRISMTRKQRGSLLRLPDTEAEILRLYTLNSDDLAALDQCRTPENRLSYALQLCCLRFPGRYLSRGELLPGIMLDHIADQVQADADVIALFARRDAALGGHRIVNTGRALMHLAHGTGVRTMKLNQRKPLALTKCPWLERTGSR